MTPHHSEHMAVPGCNGVEWPVGGPWYHRGCRAKIWGTKIAICCDVSSAFSPLWVLQANFLPGPCAMPIPHLRNLSVISITSHPHQPAFGHNYGRRARIKTHCELTLMSLVKPNQIFAGARAPVAPSILQRTLRSLWPPQKGLRWSTCC